MKTTAIDTEFLQQIETLHTLLKNNVAGRFGGNRKSRSFGSSCEFADYRDYIPGDDITKLDWNAYARFQKFYLKLYLDERQMHTRIYVDTSRSMNYGNGKKALQALRFTAAMAYLSVREMDRVSILSVRENEIGEIISGMVGRDAFLASIGKLNEVTFDGNCQLSNAILPSSVGYGDGYSIIVSDFLTDDDYESAIDLLVEKRRDVLCVQVLAQEELNPQLRGKLHLFDSEDSAKFYRKNIDRDIARAYKRAVEYATGRIRDYCMARGASYLLLPAQANLNDVFFGQLANMEVLK